MISQTDNAREKECTMAKRRKRNNRKNNKNNNRYKNRNKNRKVIKKILLGLFFVIIAAILFIGIKYGVKLYEYDKEAKRLVKEGGEEIFKANQTSIIYDADGNVITELIGERDSYYLDYKDIPYFVKAALITSEDRNFYSHSGVDYKAVIRAFLVLLQNKGEITQGGSTITQQLARNVFLSHKVTMGRKIKEMFIAKEIEKKFSKDKILEFYINNIYFGNGYYGIEAAARGYFSKSVTELSLGEIAFICAIPNNPTLYDPYTNSDETTLRKNRILKQMYENDDIDKQMYEAALYTTIVLYPSENKTNNYIETYVRYCATISLMSNSGFEFKYYFDSDEEKEKYEKEYEVLYNDISAKLYTGGYKIYTSIDLNKQQELQDIVDNNLAHYTDVNNEGIYAFQGAATCIDNTTGKVVAIVGGRTQDYKGYTLNRAYQSYRQPGSTIKPILIYTPIFERNYYPDTKVVDEPIENGPVNSPNVYEGEMTVRSAVEKSKNTIAWKLFDELSADTCLGYLKNMNFNKIVNKDYVPAVSIGGMTYGVSTLEMASAYAAIENDGVFRTPTCISKITDADYNIIVDNIEYTKSKNTSIQVKQIYQTNAARIMTDVLKGVLTVGTGRKYNISNAICAAKTGTTNDNKDVWFVGFSKYYTTAVWVGYDMPKVINDGYGNTCSGNIWKEFMTKIHDGLEIKDFVPYVTEDGILSNGEEISESQPAEETTEETADETTENEENSIYTNESDDETTTISTDNNSDKRDNRDNTETTNPYNSQVTKPSNEQAPGGADGGVYQEYWGD